MQRGVMSWMTIEKDTFGYPHPAKRYQAVEWCRRSGEIVRSGVVRNTREQAQRDLDADRLHFV